MLAHSLEPSTIERLERSGRKAEMFCGGCRQPACLVPKDRFTQRQSGYLVIEGIQPWPGCEKMEGITFKEVVFVLP